MSRWQVVSLVGLVTLIFAASAAAKPITVEFSERAGDAPAPELDLQAAGLSYDSATGELAGVVTLGAPPTFAVINSVEVYLGQFALANGRCYDTHTVSISMPDPEDVEAGLPFPYTELFRGGSTNAIGFLPTGTTGNTIEFSTAGASPEVVDALKRGRFACATIETSESGTFDVRDASAAVAFLGGPRPSCHLRRRSVQGGRSFPIRCTHAGKRVTVRLYKIGGRLFKGSERVRRGRFRVPTTRSMRGRWNITIWKGNVMIGRFLRVRVR